MARKETITRKILREEFGEIQRFYLEEARFTKKDLEERDELHRFWSEMPDGKDVPRVLWNGRCVEKYVCSLAIMRTTTRTKKSAQTVCMAFNGDRACDKEGCTFRHKCLSCDKDFSDNYLGNFHCSRCRFWKQKAAFEKRFGMDPFDPSLPGLEKDDRNFPDALRRLSADPPKKKQSSGSDAGSSSTRGFAALVSDDESDTDDASNAGTYPVGEQAEEPAQVRVDDVALKEAAAQEEARKAEAAREEARKAEAAREEARKAEAAREEARKAEAAREEARKAEAARDEARKAEVAREEARKAEAAQEEARKAEAAREEARKAEATHAEKCAEAAGEAEAPGNGAWQRWRGRQHEIPPVRLGTALPADNVLGFVCHIDTSSGPGLEVVRQSLINHAEKKVDIKEVAAQVLGQEDLLVFSYENSGLSVVVAKRFQAPNKLATRFLHAREPKARQLILFGTV